MNRGKLLVSLALNKVQRRKILQMQNKSTSAIKRKNPDPDFIPETESRSSSDSGAENEPVEVSYFSDTVNTTRRIKVLSDITIRPPLLNISNKDTNFSNENENKVLNFVQDIVEEILETVETLVQSCRITKGGKDRKRKKYITSLKERKSSKKRVSNKKYTIKEACKGNICKKNCRNISEKQRLLINKQFWAMNYLNQKLFVLSNVCKVSTKRKTNKENPTRRSNTMTYALKDENGFKVDVCKVFFLTTLGFKKTNDKVIRSAFAKTSNNSITPKSDGRGKYKHAKIDRGIIIEHINSFNPSVAHYRREHAPQRKYLPSDISIKLMYDDFKQKHPGITFSYYLYREVVSSLNISFSKLGHEECWSCEVFSKHATATGHVRENLNMDCNDCKIWCEHHKRYRSAREEYQKDCAGTEIVTTVDLQKVIMLPRCDTFKEVIFVPRLVAYNESFIPGGKNPKVSPVAIVWHEATAGRSKGNLISAFYQYFLQIRDAEHVILWVDNCSAQNKNWCLYSFFIYIVNCDEVALNQLEVKYFESGHTFMAADSFHRAVENSLKRKRKVYDFDDFVDAVKHSYKGVNVITMTYSMFYKWEDHTSQYKLNKITPRPYLQSMVCVKFKRGERTISYSSSFRGPFTQLNFLNYKSFKTGILKPNPNEGPKGISVLRKQTLIKKLKPIFPPNRLIFWEKLPTTSTVDEVPTSDGEETE